VCVFANYTLISKVVFAVGTNRMLDIVAKRNTEPLIRFQHRAKVQLNNFQL
jgi:hypothetical protein